MPNISKAASSLAVVAVAACMAASLPTSSASWQATQSGTSTVKVVIPESADQEPDQSEYMVVVPVIPDTDTHSTSDDLLPESEPVNPTEQPKERPVNPPPPPNPPVEDDPRPPEPQPLAEDEESPESLPQEPDEVSEPPSESQEEIETQEPEPDSLVTEAGGFSVGDDPVEDNPVVDSVSETVSLEPEESADYNEPPAEDSQLEDSEPVQEEPATTTKEEVQEDEEVSE